MPKYPNNNKQLLSARQNTFAMKTSIVSQALCTVMLCVCSFLACFQTAASNKLPDIGDAALSTLSYEKERLIGDLLMRQTRAQVPVNYDPLLTEYVNTLGNRLVAHADDVNFPFNFFVVNEKNINAFAFFGGNVGINAGLIAIADTESELASVFSHEIAHVTQRHLSRRIESQQRNSPLTFAGMFAGILLAMVDPQAGMAALATSQASSIQQQINFTRSNEQEADRIGMQILVRAGFNPNGAASFFDKLAASTRHVSKLPQFLLTHPLPESRITDTRLRAQQYVVRQPPPNKDFFLSKSRVIVRTMVTPANAIAHFKKELTHSYGIKQDAALYGLALAYTDAKKPEKAETLIRPLLEAEPNNLFYLDTYVDILNQTKRHNQALTLLEKHYQLRPNNSVVTLNYADTAIKAKQIDKAINRLNYFLISHKDNFLAVDLLAQAYKANGNKSRFHETRAEVYALMSLYNQSIVELNRALDVTRNDQVIAIERMEARKKQLRDDLADLKR